MNASDHDDHERNKETQAFEPLLTPEEETQISPPKRAEKEDLEQSKLSEREENKEKTDAGIKEQMLRVTSGLI
jgi:hypothetical protein